MTSPTWNKSWTQSRYSHSGLRAAAEFARSARGPGRQGRPPPRPAEEPAALVPEVRRTLAEPGFRRPSGVAVIAAAGASAASRLLSSSAQTGPGQGQLTRRDEGTPPTRARRAWHSPMNAASPNPPPRPPPKPLSQFAR